MPKLATLGLAIFVALAFIATGFAALTLMPKAAAEVCDVASMRTLLQDKMNPADKTYLQQEIDACQGNSPDEKTAAADDDAKDSDSDKEKSDDNADSSDERDWEFYANRAPAEKVSVNSYGPQTAQDPSLHGKRLEGLSKKQTLTELRYRLNHDPMLTAATGAGLELWSYDAVDAKTSAFTKDYDKWDKANDEIWDTIDSAKTSMKDLDGTYRATYALSTDGNPDVRQDPSVARNGQAALMVDDHVLRVACGFQEYWEIPKTAHKKQPATTDSPKALPKPSKGMTRTPEGTPKKETPKKPRPKTSHTTPPPEKPGKTPPPAPKPTPSHTTPPKPKPTPTPSHTTPPKPKPSPKDPSKDPAPNGNAGNGGGKNQDPGPGEYKKPDDMEKPPSGPREDPPPPKSDGGSSGDKADPPKEKPKPAPAPEPDAPSKDNPAEGCAPAPGESTC